MNLEQLLQSGEINNYFHKQLSKLHFSTLPEDLQQDYLNNAKIMSGLNVNSENEQKVFYYIVNYAQTVIFDIVENVSVDLLPKLYVDIYNNTDKYPIDSLMNLFWAVAHAAKRLGMKIKPEIAQQMVMKRAYPSGWTGQTIYQPYDISKWMRATGDIYMRVRSGEDQNQVFNLITSNWDKMEQIDYKHWLRFYQEGANKKYKTASYESDWFASPIEYNNLKSELPRPLRHVEEVVEPKPEPKPDVNEVREKIETQRSRIIGRLNAAEKLLASLEGQFFAGEDQEYMLKMLQDLKRKVQTANKITIKSSLFEDFIYRAANYFDSVGKKKASVFFYKVAQAPDLLADLGAPPPPEGQGPESAPPPPDMPAPQMPVPGEAAAPPPMAQESNPTKEAFKKFFALLETGVPDTDELSVDDALITVHAQAEPMPGPREETPIEVQEPEDEQQQPTQAKEESGVDEALERALESITVADVLKKLETLIGLYTNRTVSRELALIDLYLDKLKLSSFFPTLGEASRSALESNTYVLTRLSDIAQKLKGTLESDRSDKIVEEGLTPVAPSTPAQQSLQQQTEEEQNKKERRKQIEDAKLEGKPETNSGVGANPELQQPAQVEQSEPVIPR